MTTIADVVAAEQAALAAAQAYAPPVVTPPPATDLASSVAKDSDLRGHANVLAYLEFASIDQVNADLGASNWYDAQLRAPLPGRPWYANSTLLTAVGTHAAGTTFCVPDPAFFTDRGLAFMRASGQQRIIAAQLFAGKGIRHAFCRYVLVIDPDVVQGMTESGVKLPGFAAEYEDTIQNPPHAGTVPFSWRMEHGPVSAQMELRDYLYDGTYPVGASFGNIQDYGVPLPVGVPFTIEQELDVDAGTGNVWLDDKLVGTRKINASDDIEMLFFNIYHGGTKLASFPIHYWMAAACIATQRIGRPMELRSGTCQLPIQNVPPPLPADTFSSAWRTNAPVNQWIEIPNSSLSHMLPGVPGGNIDAWCGLAAIDDSNVGVMFVSAAGGGHTDSNDNGVYAIDFRSDRPHWYVLCPPSATADRVTAAESGAGMPAVPYAHDGKPNSCHTYWAIAWHPLAKRVIRPWAAALWYAAQGSPHMDGFDPLSEQWDKAGTYPDSPGNSYQAGFALDPTTGDIFYGATASAEIFRMTWATKTWAQIHPIGTFGWLGYHGSCVDVKRNRIVHAGSTGVGAPTDSIAQIPTLDLATLVATINPTPWIPNPPKAQRHVVHDTGLDKYVLTDSVNVYQIDPVTWQGQTLPPIPTTVVNGLHNRFAYFPSLKGIVCYPSFAANCWFLATQ